MKKLSILLSACLASVLLLSGCRSDQPNSGNVDIFTGTNPQSQPQNSESSTGTSQPASQSQGSESSAGTSQSADPEQNGSVVYMTTNISSDGLMAVYKALSASPSGKIAVKLSTGEPGSNYLRTDLIGDLVKSLNGTIVECNTAYGGSRANTAMHYQVAEDHGYTDIAAVDIIDENGSMTLPVSGGENLTENYVGANFANYDYYVVLSHFKGHAMAG